MSGQISRPISRRGFVQTIAATASAQLLAPALHALTPRSAPETRLACRAASNGIETIRVSKGRAGLEVQDRVGFLPCESPSALALGVTGRVLYAAHRAGSFEGLPCSSVSSYRVDAQGTLTPLHRERLSLACTHPDALALSPDGALLVVASRRAGILNALPLDSEGRPGAVTAARRELQWSLLHADESLHIQFVGGRLLSVFTASTQNASLYRCSLNEICPVDNGLGQNVGVAAARTPGEASLVWLGPDIG